jgi:hypothetical protein
MTGIRATPSTGTKLTDQTKTAKKPQTMTELTPFKSTRNPTKSKTPTRNQGAEQYQDISNLVGDSLEILNYDDNFDPHAEVKNACNIM